VPPGNENEAPGIVENGVNPSVNVWESPDLFSTVTFLVAVMGPEASSAPNETLTIPGSSASNATACAVAAAATSTRPAPVRPVPTYGGVAFAYTVTSSAAVFIASALSSSAVHVGWSCFSSAITPETCGVAIEVPSSETPAFPVPAATEKISRPGAAMSGLSSASPDRGPRDEKYAIVSAMSTLISVALTPGVGSSPSIVWPSASEMKNDGIVIVGSSPIIETRNDSATSSATITATAPAFCAFFTLTVKLHGFAAR